MKVKQALKLQTAATAIACALAITLFSSTFAQPSNVVAGPLEAERTKLLQRIHSMEKEHRIGTAPYLHAFSEIEGNVTGGKSAEEIGKQISHLDAAISEQIANAARKATPVHSSSSTFNVSPISGARPSPSPTAPVGRELTTYCKSIAQALQEKIKITPGLEGIHLSFTVDAAGNIRDTQFKTGSKRSVETDRMYTQLQSVKTVAPIPAGISEKNLKLMLVCCPKHGLEVGLHDVDLGPYMADFNRRVKRAWFPPAGAESARVKCSFVLGDDGRLSDLKVSKSSSNTVADESARKALQNAAPFRPLPDGSLPHVEIDFSFDINNNSSVLRN